MFDESPELTSEIVQELCSVCFTEQEVERYKEFDNANCWECSKCGNLMPNDGLLLSDDEPEEIDILNAGVIE